MESPVAEIRYQPSVQGGEEGGSASKEEGSAQVTLADGTVLQGDAVLVTVPLGVLKKGRFSLLSLSLSLSLSVLFFFVSLFFFFFFYIFFFF